MHRLTSFNQFKFNCSISFNEFKFDLRVLSMVIIAKQVQYTLTRSAAWVPGRPWGPVAERQSSLDTPETRTWLTCSLCVPRSTTAEWERGQWSILKKSTPNDRGKIQGRVANVWCPSLPHVDTILELASNNLCMIRK